MGILLCSLMLFAQVQVPDYMLLPEPRYAKIDRLLLPAAILVQQSGGFPETIGPEKAKEPVQEPERELVKEQSEVDGWCAIAKSDKLATKWVWGHHDADGNVVWDTLAQAAAWRAAGKSQPMWSLKDANGVSWEYPDKDALIKWIENRNAQSDKHLNPLPVRGPSLPVFGVPVQSFGVARRGGLFGASWGSAGCSCGGCR